MFGSGAFAQSTFQPSTKYSYRGKVLCIATKARQPSSAIHNWRLEPIHGRSVGSSDPINRRTLARTAPTKRPNLVSRTPLIARTLSPTPKMSMEEERLGGGG